MLRWSIGKIIAAIAASLVALCLLAYVVDWLVLQVHEHRGTAHGSVMVNSVDIVREKGNRVEFYDNPPEPMPCVYALFPHEGEPACWWLLRHSDQQQYLN
jgi:hypothetical protein